MLKTQKIVRGVTGLVFFTMACAAMRLDIMNNYEYGLTINGYAADAFVLAALAVVAIPTGAAAIGWRKHFLVLMFVALSVTAWCSYHAYNAKQDMALLAARDSQEMHDTAKADASAARATLAEIKEKGTVEELTKLADKASKEVTLKCATRRKEGCTQAKDNETKLIERVSNAKSRDKAQATLASIKIADSTRFEGDNIGTDRWMNRITTIAVILITLLVSTLGGYGAELMSEALKVESKKTQAQVLKDWREDPRKVTRAKPKGRKKAAPAPEETNVTRLRVQQH
jgi:hypothetical protein